MSLRIDLEYLKSLVKQGFQGQRSVCTYIGHRTSRRKLCGHDHPQGQGRIVSFNQCTAKFDIYFPFNMIRYPYAILVARGNHSHHPPYPTRLPYQVANDVVLALRQGDILAQTPRRFILSPEYQWLLKKFSTTSLRAIHTSLAIEDRLAAFIRAERIKQYPEGTDLLGVQREFRSDQLKLNEDQWFRKVYFTSDNSHFIIICCTAKQARAYAQCEHLEIDMSFKMVAGKTNLFSFVGWDSLSKRIIPYCYAFTNWNTRPGYKVLFDLLFSTLAEAGRFIIHFPHIHQTSTGLRTIGLDMCKKQAGGLGDYFHEKDPSREWYEHLQHILVFCTVHLKRNFAKKFPLHPARHMLLDKIFGSESSDEITTHMRNICTVYPELQSWVVNKQPTWLIAGLARSASKVPIAYWTFARKHTGISESSHFQENNFTGRKTSLLNATLKLKIHVIELFKKTELYSTSGISSSWRNQSEQYRQAKITQKKNQIYRKAAQRRQKHSTVPFNPENPYDSIIYTQDQGTQVNAYERLISPSVSSQHTLSQDQESNEGDTIIVDTSSVYTEHMLIPLNEQQGIRQRKRQACQISTIDSTTERVQDRVNTLRERVQKAKEVKRQRLLNEEQELLKELEELED
ncbi:hypothetical protein BGZ60DRAFT_165405 [Tricladium varicosporioides]|nr:hypothetical protein BGZ60DRAFT_165405 [Hymenoscyphus varicosporioides]